jgi:hypothetical protein
MVPESVGPMAIPTTRTQYIVSVVQVQEHADGSVQWDYNTDATARFPEAPALPDIGDMIMVEGVLHRVIDICWEYLGITANDSIEDLADLQPVVEIALFVVPTNNIGAFKLSDNDPWVD